MRGHDVSSCLIRDGYPTGHRSRESSQPKVTIASKGQDDCAIRSYTRARIEHLHLGKEKRELL